MLTFAYCFFSTWCWKNTGILWVHPNLVGDMAIFVARFGCPITTPNLLHFGLKFLFWKLSEDVRTRCCQRTWTTLHNQKPKYAIEQKKMSVTGKTHNAGNRIWPGSTSCTVWSRCCICVADSTVWDVGMAWQWFPWWHLDDEVWQRWAAPSKHGSQRAKTLSYLLCHCTL